MQVINTYYPRWRNLTIHESSPSYRGVSALLSQECLNYKPSQLFPGTRLGSMVGNIRCENLEALTFADNSIDIHITQDVFEHVFNPYTAFREISRTLRRGGAHIFTVPLVNKSNPSTLRAQISNDGSITHITPAVYHANPINNEGSLVTVDWGFDICQHIYESCGLFTHLIYIDNISNGIRAEFIEVLMTVKPETTINQISY